MNSVKSEEKRMNYKDSFLCDSIWKFEMNLSKKNVLEKSILRASFAGEMIIVLFNTKIVEREKRKTSEASLSLSLDWDKTDGYVSAMRTGQLFQSYAHLW